MDATDWKLLGLFTLLFGLIGGCGISAGLSLVADSNKEAEVEKTEEKTETEARLEVKKMHTEGLPLPVIRVFDPQTGIACYVYGSNWSCAPLG